MVLCLIWQRIGKVNIILQAEMISLLAIYEITVNHLLSVLKSRLKD
jgi:hypothetical protein